MEEISKGLRVISVLKKVVSVIKHDMECQFKEMNLTGPQGLLVGTLAHLGEMKVGDLSEKLGLSISTVSEIISKLETQGLVERRRSTEDRRVVFVQVTDRFERTTREHFQAIQKIFEAAMNKASPDELDVILKGLDTLEKLIDRQGTDVKH